MRQQVKGAKGCRGEGLGEMGSDWEEVKHSANKTGKKGNEKKEEGGQWQAQRPEK